MIDFFTKQGIFHRKIVWDLLVMKANINKRTWTWKGLLQLSHLDWSGLWLWGARWQTWSRTEMTAMPCCVNEMTTLRSRRVLQIYSPLVARNPKYVCPGGDAASLCVVCVSDEMMIVISVISVITCPCCTILFFLLPLFSLSKVSLSHEMGLE